MTVALLALIFLAVLLTLILRRALQDRRTLAVELEATRAAGARSGYESLVGRRVVAHLDNRSLRGVLVRTFHDGYTLTHPEWLQGAQPAELGGDMFLPREQTTMIQVFDEA
jgi:hypothetical protein